LSGSTKDGLKKKSRKKLMTAHLLKIIELNRKNLNSFIKFALLRLFSKFLIGLKKLKSNLVIVKRMIE
jgi:hypothetical protein